MLPQGRSSNVRHSELLSISHRCIMYIFQRFYVHHSEVLCTTSRSIIYVIQMYYVDTLPKYTVYHKISPWCTMQKLYMYVSNSHLQREAGPRTASSYWSGSQPCTYRDHRRGASPPSVTVLGGSSQPDTKHVVQTRPCPPSVLRCWAARRSWDTTESVLLQCGV